jgi:protein SCO1
VRKLTISSAMIAAVILALGFTNAVASQGPRLIDQTGRAFTLQQLRGTPLVVTFVAAHCTDVCPMINAQTAQAVSQARSGGLNVRFVTITLDPEHDTAADMRHLAATFGARPQWWIFASGSTRDVHAVMQSFDVVAQRGRSGYADVHTTFVYLVDVHGMVRKALLASTAMADQEVDAVRDNWKALTE